MFKVEKDARHCSGADRLAMRHHLTEAHWDDLHAWMQRERQWVPDGSGIARALDYSLNRWKELSRFLVDGDVSCHNNHLENLLRPWAMGRKAWLFAGSELAGQRAAIVMSLVNSALCRARHKADYADRRTMPNGLAFSLDSACDGFGIV